MTEFKFNNSFGTFLVDIYPPDRKSTLRAWDSADTYLLDEIKKKSVTGPILIVNDSCGALHISLNQYECHHLNDSASSVLCINQNLQQNKFNDDILEMKPILYPVVLIKIPKTLGLLEYQLKLLRERITPDSIIIAGGMTRHIHNSTIELFESIIGKTKTSLAKKKARLIFTELTPDIENLPETEFSQYTVPGIDQPLISLPHVFSKEKADKGTSLLLQFSKLPKDKEMSIADFGCGNGIIGIYTALQYPHIHIQGVDDSLQAVKSAQMNIEANNLTSRFRTIHGNSLSCLNGPFDLVISNPPFHQGQKIDIKPTLFFFKEAQELLKPDGHIRIVANRHLGYVSHLKKIFGNCRILAEREGYVILDSVKK